MQALILAGGEGTRLRPLTLDTPKPIVPIGNKPFLVRQILALREAGIDDITLSLNYQPTEIEKVMGDGSEFGVSLRYVVETTPMGTGGAYKFAEKYLKETTLVLNGDILTDLNFLSVIKHHRTLAAEATIVLASVENPAAYGLVQYDDEFRLKKFLEKPAPDEINRLKINTVNAGIYLFEPSVLDYIPANEKYSFEYQLFPALLDRKVEFYCFVAENIYWLDIGTPERYLKANLDLLDGKINFSGNDPNNDLIVGDNSQIKFGATVSRSIIGNDVIIEEDAVIRNSVIWSGTKIGANAKVSESIIGYNSEIGENDCLESYSVLRQLKIKI